LPSKVISGSTKVVDFGTNRKRVYDFLLIYGEEIMIVGRTMWTQSTSVTDGQTDRQADRQTDRITITKTVQRIASHCKNQKQNKQQKLT